MIAIISSTLFPLNKPIFNEPRSSFTSEERLIQTKNTISSLIEKGFTEIWLVDNSGNEHKAKIEEAIKQAHILLFDSFQFNNRGINEILLLLNALKYIPQDKQILKISGRYVLNDNFRKENFNKSNVIVKGFNVGLSKESISTRCYIVPNKIIYEHLLLKSLHEMYSYPIRIVGPRSLINSFSQKLKPSFNQETTCSVEFAFARVLKEGLYPVEYVKEIGVEGYIAGSSLKTFIQE